MLLPLGISMAVAAAGYAARTLTAAGAISATAVGTVIIVGAGWSAGAALAAFFVTTSAVSMLLPDRTSTFDAKGSRRDQFQVLANGGPAALGALTGLMDQSLGLWIVTTSLAAAAADTWATSVGALSSGPPRNILSWKPVLPGTSGGITALGTMGAAIGAAIVGSVASMASGHSFLLIGAMIIGTLGMLLDSLLGASVQASFYCSQCNAAGERPVHRCGHKAELRHGLAGVTNDSVNVLATSVAGLVGALVWYISPTHPG